MWRETAGRPLSFFPLRCFNHRDETTSGEVPLLRGFCALFLSLSLTLYCLCNLTGVNACHIPFPAKHSRLHSLLITLTGKHKKVTSVKGAFIQNNTTHPSNLRVSFVMKNSLAVTERCTPPSHPFKAHTWCQILCSCCFLYLQPYKNAKKKKSFYAGG